MDPDAQAPQTLTGQLLIAMPSITDAPFAHTVIFLCAHTPEGAMGLQLDRPIERPSFDDLMAQLEVAPAPPARRIQLMAGGPVDNARGFVLHSSDWVADATLQVDDDHGLTASLDVLKALAEGGGPRHGMLALGYVGWGPGQLDDELGRGAWLAVPADDHLLFGGDHGTKWRRALAKLNVDPARLSAAVGHA